MDLTSESLRKLSVINLTTDQMSVVLEVMADAMDKDLERKRKQAERKRMSRDSHSDNSVTVTNSPSPLVPPSSSPIPLTTTPLNPPNPDNNGDAGFFENAPKALAKTKKLIQMPENWEPNDEHRAKCSKIGYDTNKLAEEFRNFHLSKANKFADWDRAFYTWIGNAEKFGANAKSGLGRQQNQYAAPSIVEAGLRVAARYKEPF